MNLVICSGGLDSVTLAHHVAVTADGPLILATFDYGQQHGARELACAQRAANRLSAKWRRIDVTGLRQHLTGSALTDDAVALPHGHYAEETMRSTVVPNRNAIMLSLAFGIAAANGAATVWAGFHAGDHYIYPDCRPEFTAAFSEMERLALGEMWQVSLMTPFIHATKADIASRAGELNVPLHETWSCYAGGERHCGRCGTCVERLEAIWKAGLSWRDQTEYEDQDFWRSQCLPLTV